MSEAQAYLRIQAARLGRRFPRVVQLLAQGSLHLTAIKLLAPHLTDDNHVQLLEQASGKGKREIELLVAAIAPKPDVASRIRKLPETRPAGASQPDAQLAPTSVGAAFVSSARVDARQALIVPSDASAPTQESSLESPPTAAPALGPNAAAFVLEAPRQRASSRPLSPGRYKLEFTAGQALHDKLEQLKALLRHQVPDGDLAVIVERAVDRLIDDTMKRRFAQTRAAKKPRSSARSERSSADHDRATRTLVTSHAQWYARYTNVTPGDARS